MLNFTDDEWSSIANFLRTAGARFADNAQELERMENGKDYSRLAAQFRKQAGQAEDFANRICEEKGV